MSKVTESIFSGESCIIPMAEVQFVEKRRPGGINVILSGTTWNSEIDHYNNHAFLDGEEAKSFLKAWCRYRHEVEADSIADISGDTEIFPDTKKALDSLILSR